MDPTRSYTLAEAYPLEQARCRELLVAYKEIGPAGIFGYAMISEVLRRADEAAAKQDTVEMLRCYEAMQGCE